MVYKVDLDGVLLGGLKTEVTSSGFKVQAVLQNYGSVAAVQDVGLIVEGKKKTSRSVTVAAQSSQAFELPYETSQAGLYKLSLSAPGLGSSSGLAVLPAMDLSGEWLFKEGDNASWSKPELEDSSWQKVQLPAHWEDHSNYTADNVYGWYRKKIFIPVEWKGRALFLPLGKIDDCDLSFLNGKKIGQTGEFPPNFKGFWDKPRKYEVPENLIRFGKENVIAIKVFDAYGGGGLYDGPLGPIEVK